MRWMKLEPIIQSEVSQKDKDFLLISEIKEPSCRCRKSKRDVGRIPRSEGSHGGGHGNPLQYS